MPLPVAASAHTLDARVCAEARSQAGTAFLRYKLTERPWVHVPVYALVFIRAFDVIEFEDTLREKKLKNVHKYI